MINFHNWLKYLVESCTFYGSSGGGGDGGAAEREAAEKARQARAVRQINDVFGITEAQPEKVNRSDFIRSVPSSSSRNFFGNANGVLNGILSNNNRSSETVFDEEGYNNAVAAALAKAERLRGAADEREKLYTEIGTAASDKARFDLDKDKDYATRTLGFELARRGLAGGSRDADVNKDVLDTYQEGILQAANKGDAVANNARSSDERTRVNIINNIRAGLDSANAVQQAYEGMRTNANLARDEANSTSMAGFFNALLNQQSRANYNSGFDQVVNGSGKSSSKKPYSSAINGDRGNVRSY